MKLDFSDLKTFFNDRYLVVELEVEDAALFKAGDIVNINNGAYCTVSISPEDGGEIKECRACFKTKHYENEYNAHSANSICRVKEINGKILLIEMLYNVTLILHNELFADGMSIAVVDDAVKGSSVSEFDDDVQEHYKFAIGKHSYFLVGRFLQSRNEDTFILVNPLEKKYLSVVTKNLSDLQLESDNETDSKKMLVIEKQQQTLCNFSSFQFSLFRGDIEIVDKTLNAQLKTGTLAWINNGGAKYVKIWDKYAEQEMQLTDEHYNKAGELTFSSVRVNENDELVFKIENTAAIPTFQEEVDAAFGGQVVISMSNGKSFSGQLEARTNNRGEITVSADRPIAGKGSIKPNKSGSQVVYDRRQRASSAILTTDAVNPWLAEMLDGEKQSYVDCKPSERRMLDETILNNIFPHGANDRQRQAIEMAINTPDIAVIQGPPGTGKTRVIRAIFEHLQKYDKSKDAASKYLITAYQNDATFNAVEGMTDRFGLPVFVHARDDAAAGNTRQLKLWCDERAKAVSERSNLQEKREKKNLLRQLGLIRNTFNEPCTYQQAKDNLTVFLQTAQEWLSKYGTNNFLRGNENGVDPYVLKINNFLRKCDRAIRSENESVLKYYIAHLPTNPKQIADMGDIVKKTFICISADESYSETFKEELSALREIAKKSQLETEDYKRLKEIKVQMALKFNQRKELSRDDRTDVAAHTDAIIGILNEERLETKDEILLDYIDEMQPTEALTQTVKEFQSINAATHQRTLGKDFLVGKELPKFKAVLVDEAARSCPCDLLIPLACAEEKIILVGDEKQLPQFLNETTVAKLAGQLDQNELADLKNDLAGESGEKKSLFSVSMFEYVIKKVAQKFVCRDGRERVAMLDSQYRMPPTLGDFISKQFYDGKLKNGSDFSADRKVPERFKQSYPVIKDMNMVWIDVPSNGNKEQRDEGHSYFRKGEINAIFSILNKIEKEFLKNNEKRSTEDKEKIGIITGYRAQRGMIEERLNEPRWSRLKEYIEVGTIDSFQGKEFDIVFLSCVRTDGYGFMNIKEQDTDDFTLSRAGKQRTCVAFSRAKKCMIVVWDSSRVSEKGANDKIPAFVEYYNLCRNNKDGVCKVIETKELA